MKKLQNKTLFITGGLSVIGKACAIAAAKEGANIVVAARKSVNVDRAIEEIKWDNPKAIFIDCDVSVEAEVQAAIEKTIRVFGSLDVALNNTVFRCKPNEVGEVAEKAWLKVVDSNLNGVHYVMQQELTQMAKQKNGVIVNMTAIFGSMGFESSPQGVAANQGVMGLTLTSALEFATLGIRLNSICPGFFDTPPQAKGGITGSEEVKQHVNNAVPRTRSDKAAQIINSFIFLSCADSSFATGNIIEIGGGYIVL